MSDHRLATSVGGVLLGIHSAKGTRSNRSASLGVSSNGGRSNHVEALRRKRGVRVMGRVSGAGPFSGIGVGDVPAGGATCGTPQLPEAHPPVAQGEAGQMVCGTIRQTSYVSTRGTHLVTMRVHWTCSSRGTQRETRLVTVNGSWRQTV